MAYVADLYGATLYEPEVDLLGRRKRRKRKRSLKGLKRKLRKKGVLRKLKARLKKKGLLRKLRKRLKSKRGKRRLKTGIAALTTGPFAAIARRIRKRRRRKAAAKRKAALRRVGAAAIAPSVEAEDMVEQADVDNEAALEPEEVNTMAPELAVRQARARVAKALRMTEADDEGEAEDMEPEDMEPDDDTAEGEVQGTTAGGGIMAMVKRNPMLVAIPAGAVLLLMLSGKRRGAGA